MQIILNFTSRCRTFFRLNQSPARSIQQTSQSAYRWITTETYTRITQAVNPLLTRMGQRKIPIPNYLELGNIRSKISAVLESCFKKNPTIKNIDTAGSESEHKVSVVISKVFIEAFEGTPLAHAELSPEVVLANIEEKSHSKMILENQIRVLRLNSSDGEEIARLEREVKKLETEIEISTEYLMTSRRCENSPLESTTFTEEDIAEIDETRRILQKL